MSHRAQSERRLSLATRVQRARRRFTLYQAVVLAIEHERSQGGRPLEMVWRRPESELRRLFRTAGAALRALGARPSSAASPDKIAELERAVDQIAAADDWTRRLGPFWSALRTERARRALTTLVRKGCVPHNLAQDVTIFASTGERQALEAYRRELRGYSSRLTRLAASFMRLAQDCEAHTRLPERNGVTPFRLDRQIATFLRDEAAQMREYIDDADPGRRTLTMPHWHLMEMMRDIKTITGSFQDRLVADFLNGVPEIRVTVAQLRRMRARHRTKTAAWKPPRYLRRPASRPASRIVMDGGSPQPPTVT